jgi:sedoheptulokinase
MAEYVMGVDFGTSKVAAVLVDPGKNRILASSSRQLAGLPRHPEGVRSEQPVESAASAFEGCMEELVGDGGFSLMSIGLTSQMHGILGLDVDGRPGTPLVTWQDGRGLEPQENGMTLLDEMKHRGGPRPIASGYGVVTLYDWKKRGLLEHIAQVCTIADYFGMVISGSQRASIDFTMAESLGTFDVRGSVWDEQYLNALGISPTVLPRLLPPTSALGKLEKAAAGRFHLEPFTGTPVAVAIGDNQASFIGSVKDYFATLLVNIGTASQVSFAVRSLEDENLHPSAIDGYDVILRPFVDGGFLVAGNALSGGATYTTLRNFLAAIGRDIFDREAPPDLWDRMNSLAARSGGSGGLRVETLFAGKRSDPDVRGSISGISSTNFMPDQLLYATLEGIVRVMRELVGDAVSERMTLLVGSGNGMRKNELLRDITSRIFRRELRVPRYEEEAAVGAAINGAVAAGVFSGFSDSVSLVQY